MSPKFISIIGSQDGGGGLTMDEVKKYVDEQIATAKKYTDEKASSKNFVTRAEGNRWGFVDDLRTIALPNADNATIDAKYLPGVYGGSRSDSTKNLPNGAVVLVVFRYDNDVYQFAQLNASTNLFYRVASTKPIRADWKKIAFS